MPKRSNEFQRLVALLTMLKSEGATVHESVEVMEIASQEPRGGRRRSVRECRRSPEHRLYRMPRLEAPTGRSVGRASSYQVRRPGREREGSRLVQRIHEVSAGEGCSLRDQGDHAR